MQHNTKYPFLTLLNENVLLSLSESKIPPWDFDIPAWCSNESASNCLSLISIASDIDKSKSSSTLPLSNIEAICKRSRRFLLLSFCANSIIDKPKEIKLGEKVLESNENEDLALIYPKIKKKGDQNISKIWLK